MTGCLTKALFYVAIVLGGALRGSEGSSASSSVTSVSSALGSMSITNKNVPSEADEKAVYCGQNFDLEVESDRPLEIYVPYDEPSRLDLGRMSGCSLQFPPDTGGKQRNLYLQWSLLSKAPIFYSERFTQKSRTLQRWMESALIKKESGRYIDQEYITLPDKHTLDIRLLATTKNPQKMRFFRSNWLCGISVDFGRGYRFAITTYSQKFSYLLRYARSSSKKSITLCSADAETTSYWTNIKNRVVLADFDEKVAHNKYRQITTTEARVFNFVEPLPLSYLADYTVADYTVHETLPEPQTNKIDSQVVSHEAYVLGVKEAQVSFYEQMYRETPDLIPSKPSLLQRLAIERLNAQKK